MAEMRPFSSRRPKTSIILTLTTEYYPSLRCSAGYRSYSDYPRACKNAICNGQITKTGACSGSVRILTRKGVYKTESSQGECVSPEKCTCKSNNFYDDGPVCKECPAIPHCHESQCTKVADNICVYCDGEVEDREFFRAYTRKPSNGELCEKACSWRSDSTRCFPGRCDKELASNCKCIKGFAGHHCEIMQDYATISYSLCTLQMDDIYKLDNPKNPNSLNSTEIIWTKETYWKTAKTKWDALYVLQESIDKKEDHYVKDFKYGLVHARSTLQYISGTLDIEGNETDYNIINLEYECPGPSNDDPISSSFTCENTFQLENIMSFQHNDTLLFKIHASIGGHVIILNREQKDKEERHNFQGTTKELIFTYRWDTELPYHCIQEINKTDCPDFLTVLDLTENPTFMASWDGWTDDLAGLHIYEYEVYELITLHSTLQEVSLVKTGNISQVYDSLNLTLNNPGMYAIHFTAVDKAGNSKTSRKLVFFDDISKVTFKNGKVSRVETATENTQFTWVIQDTNGVLVAWKDRFRNQRHENNRWLNAVKPYINIEDLYDDHTGKRSIKELPNVHGCVEFLVSFNIQNKTGIKSSKNFTRVHDLEDESEFLTLNWTDGDKADITVRAVDIFDKFLDETVTIYRDATPPHIEQLWLTRGDRLNISVHNMEDFAKMTIEWIAYDLHSGLQSISWRLFDNYTGESILHGHDVIPVQGMAKDLDDCNQKYINYSRGPNCYQTPFFGAYHKHFQVKPSIKEHGGLLIGKDLGVHDSDYYLEINATNTALLSTVLTKKITIDTSPPHTGFVQDGIKGSGEIDFQQSKILHAYWDGFFDRESGVLFFQYAFSRRPLHYLEFRLDTGNTMPVETYSLHATHNVSSKGTYYACVVAYNRALEPSKPVCSDGVTITTAVPKVREVYISNAYIRGGLITDSNQTFFWEVNNARYRRRIIAPTTDCKNKASVVAGIDLLPILYRKNGSIDEVQGPLFCGNTSSAAATLNPILAKASHVTLTWSADNTSVHDYEVGFSSTSGSSAPDIIPFRSTKQHRRIHFMHTDIPEGTPFYIVIKSISKANVEGFQFIGPCYLDTTGPEFSPPIRVTHSQGHLVVTWDSAAFTDAEDPYPLRLQFAVGHQPRSSAVQKYLPLNSGGPCNITVPPTCTFINISTTDWGFHGNHTYFITVKAENVAGLTTYGVSEPYLHNVQLPSKGIVMDVVENEQDVSIVDIEDIDFTPQTTILSAHWTGFFHNYLDVDYFFRAGTTPGGNDIFQQTNVGRNSSYTATGLNLNYFKKYYITITANTSAGSVEVSSDGVTVVKQNGSLSGVIVYDGEPCIISEENVSFTHHDEDNRLPCLEDNDYQSSTDILTAYWKIPQNVTQFTPDLFVMFEVMSSLNNKWEVFRDYMYIFGRKEIKRTSMLLSPGMKYRAVLKLCASEICYKPVSSDGIIVLANPPVTGYIKVKHLNSSDVNKEQLKVKMDRFYDPDIKNFNGRYDVVDKYEWAITDQSKIGRTHTQWKKLNNITISLSKTEMTFILDLEGKFDFSKCRGLAIRGYNKAKLYSTVYSHIKDCEAFDPVLIKPNVVIDAVGKPDPYRDGYGDPIILETNAHWPFPDQDYTPNMNYISAVWPKLRYDIYSVAVLDARSLDVTTYYLPANALSLSDPCSHSDAIKCSRTENEFINFKFKRGELVHGHRYIICIHAENTTKIYEEWTEILPEMNKCSDGVVLDLTPPVAGNIWIGTTQGQEYQSSSSVLYINWDSFQDVEDFKTISHSSGIQNYRLGIGTSAGGNDVVAFFDVGVVNHKAIHGLSLINGQSYYATLSGIDFANRTTTKTSPPMIVDITPPKKSDEPITLANRHITSDTEISACWKNVFHDPESEISYYEWSIGSKSGYDDVMKFTRTYMDCSENNKIGRLQLKEGHAYFISVKAVNNAGLMSMATSWAYTVDLTPPTIGHVLDISPMGKEVLDIDFQTETSKLFIVWKGFYDPHSSINEYLVSIGSCSRCEDVLVKQCVGVKTELLVDNVHLGVGITYYTTVMACNTANLCSEASSDGVIIDSSPPSLGRVIDGTDLQDIEYQSASNFISARWLGFNDPQSGLSHFVWWVGTTPGGDEILLEREGHLTEVAVALNITPQLPVGKRLYISVRAYNNAGLYTEATSNGFQIDNTPPVISRGPVFSKDFGVKDNTQFYRTLMKVEWDVSDSESYIERQYISLRSHMGGDFDLSSTQINGIARDFVITGLNLHDGVTYFVTIVSCNGAQICSTSNSPGILVDSTPPNRGMFAIKTDHAAELHRHLNDSMTWTKYSLNLAWLGFADIHSDVIYYFINVGSYYMGADLNNEPVLSERVNHTTTGADRFDEGKVQTSRIKTAKLGPEITHVFVSMWAVNKVGLSSSIIHSKFRKLPDGSLFLIRRCEAATCKGHCVCAPQDQVCHHNNETSCSDVSNRNTNNLLQVIDVMSSQTDIDYTPSNTLLQGRWRIVQRQGKVPLWYEWSVGLTQNSEPTGIFHQEVDRVWQDAGQNNFMIFSTNPGFFLEEDEKYSVFVKAWYSYTSFAIFKSNGVTVVTGTPSVTNVLGSAVCERMMDSKFKDQDFILDGVSFVVDWKNKFVDAEHIIRSFQLYISTHQEGHDIWEGSKTLQNTQTSYRVRRISLIPGVQYFSNVIAYGLYGIHHTEVSDGFMVDNVKPTAGTVFDGIGLHDLQYQNMSNIVGARWHGFGDTGSGIVQYYWCVGISPAISNELSETECNVLEWNRVGMHTYISRTLSQNFTNGQTLYNKVYAIDNVNSKSSIAVSNGVVIDITPPQPQYLFHEDKILAKNPSFEVSEKNISINDINQTNVCSLNIDYLPHNWTLTPSSCGVVVSTNKNLARNGKSFLYVRGSITQNISHLVSGELYRVNFFSSHLLIHVSKISSKEGFINIGKTKHVFMLYSKAYRQDEHGKSKKREIVSWHRHTFYFVAPDNWTVLEIGSNDKTGLFLDDVALQRVERNNVNKTEDLHVNAHVVYLHEWGSIHGSWSFIEDISTIKEYKWAIGYTKGGTQLQGFKSVGISNFAYNTNVTLVHKTYIHVTAVAFNTAGLQGISYSKPVIVDLTPPVIRSVNDGRLLNVDEDAWTDNEVAVNFEVEDEESGVDFCEWAIGFQPQGIELQSFVHISESLRTTFTDFPYSKLANRTLFSTIRCHNRAGLTSSRSTNGVKISIRHPSIRHAEINIIPLSNTEYPATNHYQSVTNNIRIQWSGFEDYVGLEQYKITCSSGKSTIEEKMSFPNGQDILSMNIINMNMSEGFKNISVQAINKVLLKSSNVQSNLTVAIGKPKKGNKEMIVNWHSGKNEFTVFWGGIFSSAYPLYYEVSAGTVEGGSDILQWLETTSTNVTFGLPLSVTNWEGLHAHIFVRAISVGGEFNNIKGFIRLPK
ncbi:uncharacterized protein LOC134277752 [Saccostrea cucullata]|uniref:uncharacterized protein LOC134277752 n=1 Tax=Saccostrea cuccullata TaxID=36930 RepID=UPI002ED37B61